MNKNKNTNISSSTVIENVAQTKKLAETSISNTAPTTLPKHQPQIEEDRPTNNTSNSQVRGFISISLLFLD